MAIDTITANKDTFYVSYNSNNYGSQTYMAVGCYEISTKTARSVISFDVAHLTGLTINTVLLKLYAFGLGGSTYLAPYSLNKLTRNDWEEMGATWNNYKSGSAWTSPGGDTIDIPSPIMFYGPSGEGWITLNVTDLVNDAISNGVNLNLLLQPYSYYGNTLWNIYSKENTTNKPYLTVDYTCPTITISPTSATRYDLTAGMIGTAYTYALSQTGGGTYWTISSGALPNGLSISSTTGAISGYPTTTGIFNFTVKCWLYSGSTCYDTQDYAITIGTITQKTFTDSIAPASLSDSWSVSKVSSPEAPNANNNQAYVYNIKTNAWTYLDNFPFSNLIYRPSLRQLWGARRNAGNISRVNYGDSFDGANINSNIQFGYFDFGSQDEVAQMTDEMSWAIKRLRALYTEMKGEGEITVTIFTEGDEANGTSFPIKPTTTDNATTNIVKTALSRSIKGKFISMKITNANGEDFFIGKMALRTRPRGTK